MWNVKAVWSYIPGRVHICSEKINILSLPPNIHRDIPFKDTTQSLDHSGH